MSHPVSQDKFLRVFIKAVFFCSVCCFSLTAEAKKQNGNDSDHDHLPDTWELRHFGSLRYGRGSDPDGDGLSNNQERQKSTNPIRWDTDGDGLSDGDEVSRGLSPLHADSDWDGISDGSEVRHGTNPLSADTDADGLRDGDESKYSGDPNNPDTDGDGLRDGDEVKLGSSVRRKDTDGDGLLDGEEAQVGTDPTRWDTDGDGMSDSEEILMGLDPMCVDTDEDGLSDGDEKGNKTDPLNADTDGDGLLDGEEVRLGTLPTQKDTDEDGIPDREEVSLGLNPVEASDAWKDRDGDGVPNIFEWHGKSDTLSATSRPVPDRVVDATVKEETATVKRTLASAIESLSDSDLFSMIEMKSGSHVIEEPISLKGRRILILGEAGARKAPRLICPAGDYAFMVYPSDEYVGIYWFYGLEIDGNQAGAFLQGGKYSSKSPVIGIVNSDIHDCRGYSTLSVAKGTLSMDHCTFRKNGFFEGQYVGYWKGILDVGNIVHVFIRNSIFWNPDVPEQRDEEIRASWFASGYGISVEHSVIRGALFGMDGGDPLLDPLGFLQEGSSAIGKGADTERLVWDLAGFTRTQPVDCGAYAYRGNVDQDALPDAWEWQFFGHLDVDADGDFDGDGVSNLLEYHFGFNPTRGDTFGNGVGDRAMMAVFRRDPNFPEAWKVDRDGDGMYDYYEEALGFSAGESGDGLEDPDRDRIPNVYEFAYGTNPLDASSVPVDGVHTLSPGGSLGGILQQIPDLEKDPEGYWIVMVKPGVYKESLIPGKRRVLILGEGSLAEGAPRFVSTDGYWLKRVELTQHQCVIDGVEIERIEDGRDAYMKTVWVDLGGEDEEVRLINCIFRYQFFSQSAHFLHVEQGGLTLIHCTLQENQSQVVRDKVRPYWWRSYPIFKVASQARLRILHSLLWHPFVPEDQRWEVAAGSGGVTVEQSMTHGAYGGLDFDPLLDAQSRLGAGSPAIDLAGHGYSPLEDMLGQLRIDHKDLGAVQVTDWDADGMPDVSEYNWFGNLDEVPGGDFDQDGLSNELENKLGFAPTQADTFYTGRGDYEELLYWLQMGFLKDAVWFADEDGDGLTYLEELLAGSNPLLADTDGDGLGDKVIFDLGFSPTSLDADGDGLSNIDEMRLGTLAFVADSDGDGVVDGLDAFPLNADLQTWPEVAVDTQPPRVVLLSPLGARKL